VKFFSYPYMKGEEKNRKKKKRKPRGKDIYLSLSTISRGGERGREKKERRLLR